jgi:hypothetical protein
MELNHPARQVLDAYFAKWRAEEDLRLAEDKLKRATSESKVRAPFKRRI